MPDVSFRNLRQKCRGTAQQVADVLFQARSLCAVCVPCDISAFMLLPGDLPYQWEVLALISAEPWANLAMMNVLKHIGCPYATGSVLRCPIISKEVMFDTIAYGIVTMLDMIKNERKISSDIEAEVLKRSDGWTFGCIWLLLRLGFIRESVEDDGGDDDDDVVVLHGHMYTIQRDHSENGSLWWFCCVMSACAQQHPRPHNGDYDGGIVDPNRLEDYTKNCIQGIQHAFDLGLGWESELGALARKIYLRADFLTGGGQLCTGPIGHQKFVNKIWWHWRSIKDMAQWVPNARKLLEGFEQKTTWAEIADAFSMHPMYAMEMALAIQDAIEVHGIDAVIDIFHDVNSHTQSTIMNEWLSNTTKRIPPTPTALVESIMKRKQRPTLKAITKKEVKADGRGLPKKHNGSKANESNSVIKLPRCRYWSAASAALLHGKF